MNRIFWVSANVCCPLTTIVGGHESVKGVCFFSFALSMHGAGMARYFHFLLLHSPSLILSAVFVYFFALGMVVCCYLLCALNSFLINRACVVAFMCKCVHCTTRP